ncbi:MAG: hypothetical protein HYZ34_09980 [Ignavibacteriae bacterium]|nr:hypothetical protein [Ignavibacteriota bacterium]
MNTVTLSVKNKEKFSFVLELLRQLKIAEVKNTNGVRKSNHKYDFFKSAGLWKDRNITAEQLREEAWQRKR